ncbi:MAG: hypothetical protein REJ23_03895 [Brevundimonas sp.]|nr:hypothetical protein [Brevundimonas sp.]
MKPDDVGSLWGLHDQGAAFDSPSETPHDLYEATLAGVGPVQMSGWVAVAAIAAMRTTTSPNLTEVLADADLDDAERSRILDTLAAGGGVVGVKARESLAADDDLV